MIPEPDMSNATLYPYKTSWYIGRMPLCSLKHSKATLLFSLKNWYKTTVVTNNKINKVALITLLLTYKKRKLTKKVVCALL